MSDVPPAPPPGGPDQPFPAFGGPAPAPWGTSPGDIAPPPPPPAGPGAFPGAGAPVWSPVPGGGTAVPSRSGLAVASLVLGIIGVVLCVLVVPSVLAIVFGAVSLKTIKASNGAVTGRSLARWGLGLGIVGVVLFVVLLVIGAVTEDTDTGSERFEVSRPVIDAGDTPIDDLVVGDCIDTVIDSGVAVVSVDVVDCSAPHTAEVYALGELDLEGDFPGDAVVRNLVENRCVDEFEGYVGVGIDQSDLRASAVRPTAATWDEGDRGYQCIVKAPTAPMVGSDARTIGSVRGTGR